MMEQTVILILMGIGVTSLVYAASHALARWYGDYQETYVQRTERDLYGMFSNLPPHRFLQWSIGCFLAVFLVTFFLVGNYESTVGFLISFGFSLLLGAGGSLLPRATPSTLTKKPCFSLCVVGSSTTTSKGQASTHLLQPLQASVTNVRPSCSFMPSRRQAFTHGVSGQLRQTLGN